MWYLPQSTMALYIYRVGRSCLARKSFYKPNLSGLLNLAWNRGHWSDRCSRRADLPEVISPLSGLRFGRSTYQSWSTRRDISNDKVQIVFCGHWPQRSDRWDAQVWPDLPILGANRYPLFSGKACVLENIHKDPNWVKTMINVHRLYANSIRMLL
jgi:hypothetical protein